MLGRRAKVAVLGVALLVLAVEGLLLIRYYDRYYGSDTASGTPSSSAPAFEATMPEGTMPEVTAAEETSAAGGTPSSVEKASFVHRSTDKNSRSDYTYIDDPRLNGDPNAVVLAAPTPDRERTGTTTYAHNIGVWYTPVANKWAIYNQDQVAMSSGETFEVAVPRAREAFVHSASPSNTVGNATYLDDPLTNGKAEAEVSVTQNWNPGGGGGVYNDHPVGALYDGDVDRWFVYNEDGAPMPEGAAFNVAVSGAEPAG